MAARRRSQKRGRLLDDFADRSPMHALGVGAIRIALMATIAVVGYLVMMNLVIPNGVDSMVEGFRNADQ